MKVFAFTCDALEKKFKVNLTLETRVFFRNVYYAEYVGNHLTRSHASVAACYE